MILKDIYLLTFEVEESNGYIYDISLSTKIAKEVVESNFIGFIKKGKIEEYNNGIKISTIRAEVNYENLLILYVDLEVDEEKLPKLYKKFYENSWRLAIFTYKNKLNDNVIVGCDVIGYGIEIVD